VVADQPAAAGLSLLRPRMMADVEKRGWALTFYLG
jgi:hypothetical protein